MGGGPGGKRTIGRGEGGGIAVWGAETAEGKFQIGNPGGPVGGHRGAGNERCSHEGRGTAAEAERVHVAWRSGVGRPHQLCSEFEQHLAVPPLVTLEVLNELSPIEDLSLQLGDGFSRLFLCLLLRSASALVLSPPQLRRLPSASGFPP